MHPAYFQHSNPCSFALIEIGTRKSRMALNFNYTNTQNIKLAQLSRARITDISEISRIKRELSKQRSDNDARRFRREK